MALLRAICDLSETEPPILLATPILLAGAERVADPMMPAAVSEAALSIEHLGRVGKGAVDSRDASH